MTTTEKIPIRYRDSEFLLSREEYDTFHAKCSSRVERLLKPMIDEFLSGGVACEGDDDPMQLDDIVEQAASILSQEIDNLLYDYPEVHMSDLEYGEEYEDNEDEIRDLAEYRGIRYINTGDHPGKTVDVSEARERNRHIEIFELEEAANYLVDHGII